MKCPECRTGVLSRTRKPDALGRIIEKCDACAYRRVINKGDDTAPMLSAPRSVTIPASPAAVAAQQLKLAMPVAVIGTPCPTCHRKVRKLPLCVKCTTRPRVLGKSRCESCSRPAPCAARFCMKCGKSFTPEHGEKLKGLDAARCPEHRAPKEQPAHGRAD